MMDKARQIDRDLQRHDGGDSGPRRQDYQDAGKKALVRSQMPFAPPGHGRADEWAARSNGPRVCVSIVIQQSFVDRLIAPVILPMRAVSCARGCLAKAISDASFTTRGLPWFSRSSSNRSDR